MGDLYRAVDEVLDRPVVVKLLATRFAGHTPGHSHGNGNDNGGD